MFNQILAGLLLVTMLPVLLLVGGVDLVEQIHQHVTVPQKYRRQH